MKAAELRELLADVPDYYDVCVGAAGRFAGTVEVESYRWNVRLPHGGTGADAATVVVIR